MNVNHADAIEIIVSLEQRKPGPFTTAQRLQLAAIHAQLAVAAELRTANELRALELGTAGLDDVELSTKSELTAARQTRMNTLRGRIRAALGVG